MRRGVARPASPLPDRMTDTGGTEPRAADCRATEAEHLIGFRARYVTEPVSPLNTPA
ncbi:hypothetical protein ACWDCX_24640 [Streptomyces fungicidicus]|uniref:hypothetical protein n=1 Tax=Streptomyces fungicidicus TaxID=68203 RepID=UPI0036B3768E